MNEKILELFIVAYHNNNNKCRVYSDNMTSEIIKREEYKELEDKLKGSIYFYNPSYIGNNPLRWVMDNKLSSSILTRLAFLDKNIKLDIKLGAKTLVLLNPGYIGVGNKYKNINVYELDTLDIIKDKKSRVEENNIHYEDINNIEKVLKSIKSNNKIFISMMNMTNKLNIKALDKLLNIINNNTNIYTTLVLDYNNKTYKEIEDVLYKNDFLIYEHLNYKQIEGRLLETYNIFNKDNKMKVEKNENYILAVKR